jgi:hypothetical protein
VIEKSNWTRKIINVTFAAFQLLRLVSYFAFAKYEFLQSFHIVAPYAPGKGCRRKAVREDSLNKAKKIVPDGMAKHPYRETTGHLQVRDLCLALKGKKFFALVGHDTVCTLTLRDRAGR